MPWDKTSPHAIGVCSGILGLSFMHRACSPQDCLLFLSASFLKLHPLLSCQAQRRAKVLMLRRGSVVKCCCGAMRPPSPWRGEGAEPGVKFWVAQPGSLYWVPSGARDQRGSAEPRQLWLCLRCWHGFWVTVWRNLTVLIRLKGATAQKQRTKQKSD